MITRRWTDLETELIGALKHIALRAEQSKRVTTARYGALTEIERQARVALKLASEKESK